TAWDMRTGRRRRTFDARAFGFSADGRRVATFEADDLSGWDSQTWQRVAPAHRYPLTDSWALSPDLRRLAIERSNNKIVLWNVAGHRAMPGSLLAQSRGGWIDLAFNSDGRMLASQEEAGQVLLWNVAKPGGLARLIPAPHDLGGKEGGLTIAYSPDGR